MAGKKKARILISFEMVVRKLKLLLFYLRVCISQEFEITTFIMGNTLLNVDLNTLFLVSYYCIKYNKLAVNFFILI